MYAAPYAEIQFRYDTKSLNGRIWYSGVTSLSMLSIHLKEAIRNLKARSRARGLQYMSTRDAKIDTMSDSHSMPYFGELVRKSRLGRIQPRKERHTSADEARSV